MADIVYSNIVFWIKEFLLHFISIYENIMKAYQKKPYQYANNRRHYNRFLYRALRFSQQYKEWFTLFTVISKGFI